MMNDARRWFFVGALLAVAMVAGATTNSEEIARFQIYPLGESDPSAILEAARALAGDEATIALDAPGHRLLVVAPDRVHQKLAELLAPAAKPPCNVRIEVQFRKRSSNREAEVSIEGDGEVVHEKGLLSTKIRIRPRILAADSSNAHDVRQVLIVADGGEALLRVGEAVPYLDWLMEYGWRGGWIRERVVWQEVGAFLAVRPKIIGEGPAVRIRLTPELRGRVEGHPYRVRFAGVETEVVVSDGQTMPLGGLDEHRDFRERFLVGGRSVNVAETLEISLTPRILGATGP